MKIQLAIALTAILSLSAHAQLINPEAPQDFHSDPSFNPAFLKANGIQAIHVEYHSKRDGQPMIPRGESDEYTFDASGKVTNVQRIRNFAGRPDTTIKMVWSSDCEIIVERQGRYLTATRTCVQADNKLSEKFTLSRWPAGTDDLSELKETELFSERIVAEPSNGTNHTYTFSNNLGLPFKRERHIQNEFGYLTTIRTEWMLSSDVNEKRFSYDKNGRLESVEYHEGKELISKKTLQWDGASNLVSIEESGMGSKFNTEIIYGSDALIHSYIRINRETNEMIIARFRYNRTSKSQKP